MKVIMICNTSSRFFCMYFFTVGIVHLKNWVDASMSNGVSSFDMLGSICFSLFISFLASFQDRKDMQFRGNSSGTTLCLIYLGVGIWGLFIHFLYLYVFFLNMFDWWMK